MEQENTTPEIPAERVLVLNGFSDQELVTIMRAVKALYRPGPDGTPATLPGDPGDLIFAKTTPHSLGMVLRDLIGDVSGDHAWLRANPPSLA